MVEDEEESVEEEVELLVVLVEEDGVLWLELELEDSVIEEEVWEVVLASVVEGAVVDFAVVFADVVVVVDFAVFLVVIGASVVVVGSSEVVESSSSSCLLLKPSRANPPRQAMTNCPAPDIASSSEHPPTIRHSSISFRSDSSLFVRRHRAVDLLVLQDTLEMSLSISVCAQPVAETMAIEASKASIVGRILTVIELGEVEQLSATFLSEPCRKGSELFALLSCNGRATETDSAEK